MSDRISTFSGFYSRDYQTQSLQSQLNTVTGEVSSGLQANPTAQLQTTIGTAENRLDTAQTVLSSMGSITQTIANAALAAGAPGSNTDQAYSALAQQATSAISTVLGQLNTSSAGGPIFSGDSGTAPMQAADAPGGPMAAIQSTLNAAVASAGGALSQTNVSTLLAGFSSMFSDANAASSQNYTGAFYAGSTDGKPTTVLTGANQNLTYNASANQPAFRDLLQGLSMLSTLSAPSSQMDDTAKAALVTQASTLISNAQGELTSLQGNLGAVQSQMKSAITEQNAVASATQQQINGYEQTDTATDATMLSTLQTQIQASYQITSAISQLSLVHYMPAGL
jgi:flagellar hook-associated protein 3 FlgL